MRSKRAAAAAVSLLLAAGGLAVSGTAVAAGTPTFSARTASCNNASQLAKWSNRHLAMMTIAVPVEETTPSDVAHEVANGAGGVLLFGTAAPTNLHALLQTLRNTVPGHLGLLVMTDEEGGGVQRMANLVGNLPWAATMGKDWTPAQIESAVETVGKKMAAAGVNMDLAPVVDVDGRNVPPSDTDPDGWRSFSGKTSVVTKDALAYSAGLEKAGVIPVFKHFPGLGGASGNTDVEPAHTLPWPELEKVAIPPFKAGIKAGIPAIMVSNATVPGLASYPASLSPAAIGRELKTTLGYKGLVMTDSLTAVAISAAGFSVAQAAVQALIAGADMVLFGLVSNVRTETADMASAIVAAVGSGKLPRSRLISAAGAVLAVRHKSLCDS